MLVKKVKPEMKAHFFDKKDPNFKYWFLATFMVVRDTSKIHKGAAMWVLSHFVRETITNTLKSRM